MQTLIAHDPYFLVKENNPTLPFCWFKNFADHQAEFRNDGMVYIAGFQTKELAELWAREQRILPSEDPQGEL